MLCCSSLDVSRIPGEMGLAIWHTPGGPDAAAAAFWDVEVDVPPGGPSAAALGPPGDGGGAASVDGLTGSALGFGAGAVTGGGGGGGGGGGEGTVTGQLKLLGTLT